ncbi:hypothetical protein HDU76_000800 [Blyttiomyces sp. JEL0837]|nr:hypothetical protein HDU76_000800 [Blyttiomyces sp. JEL0837]
MIITQSDAESTIGGGASSTGVKASSMIGSPITPRSLEASQLSSTAEQPSSSSLMNNTKKPLQERIVHAWETVEAVSGSKKSSTGGGGGGGGGEISQQRRSAVPGGGGNGIGRGRGYDGSDQHHQESGLKTSFKSGAGRGTSRYNSRLSHEEPRWEHRQQQQRNEGSGSHQDEGWHYGGNGGGDRRGSRGGGYEETKQRSVRATPSQSPGQSHGFVPRGGNDRDYDREYHQQHGTTYGSDRRRSEAKGDNGTSALNRDGDRPFAWEQHKNHSDDGRLSPASNSNGNWPRGNNERTSRNRDDRSSSPDGQSLPRDIPPSSTRRASQYSSGSGNESETFYSRSPSAAGSWKSSYSGQHYHHSDSYHQQGMRSRGDSAGHWRHNDDPSNSHDEYGSDYNNRRQQKRPVSAFVGSHGRDQETSHRYNEESAPRTVTVSKDGSLSIRVSEEPHGGSRAVSTSSSGQSAELSRSPITSRLGPRVNDDAPPSHQYTGSHDRYKDSAHQRPQASPSGRTSVWDRLGPTNNSPTGSHFSKHDETDSPSLSGQASNTRTGPRTINDQRNSKSPSRATASPSQQMSRSLEKSGPKFSIVGKAVAAAAASTAAASINNRAPPTRTYNDTRNRGNSPEKTPVETQRRDQSAQLSEVEAKHVLEEEATPVQPAISFSALSDLIGEVPACWADDVDEEYGEPVEAVTAAVASTALLDDFTPPACWADDVDDL